MPTVNKVNDVLIMDSGLTSIKNEKEGNVVKFFNEDGKVVALNIFSPGNFESGLVNFEQVDKKYIDLFEVEIKNPFINGYVLETEAHPKSVKLKVCKVDLGHKVEQIVCGASNCQEDATVVVAQVGAILPSGMKIVPAKVIDVESNGMLCSFSELGINIESNGIILNAVSKDLVGTSYIKE